MVASLLRGFMGSPSVNPKFANYVCMDDLKDRPWAQIYDIKGDSHLGVDDLKALLPSPEDLPIDESKETLDISCLQAKIIFVGKEVEWKLKGLIARQAEEGSRSTSLFSEIDSMEKEVLARIKDLSSGHKDLAMADKVRSSVVEMDLRAHNILKDEKTDEPFGIGVSLVPQSASSSDWQIKVGGVHPAGAAALAGILPGDILLAIDRRSMQQWSADGTPAGLVDPEIQLVRGLSGSRNSEVKVTLQRGGNKLDVTLKRNIWSAARHLGTPCDALPPWDGQEHPLPPLGLPTKSPVFGCGSTPGAKP